MVDLVLSKFLFSLRGCFFVRFDETFDIRLLFKYCNCSHVRHKLGFYLQIFNRKPIASRIVSPSVLFNWVTS